MTITDPTFKSLANFHCSSNHNFLYHRKHKNFKKQVMYLTHSYPQTATGYAAAPAGRAGWICRKERNFKATQNECDCTAGIYFPIKIGWKLDLDVLY